MSVKFDKTNLSGDGDWLKADDDTNMDPSFPGFSVSLWFYIEADVGGTETIWFYGDKDHTDKYLVLELIKGNDNETFLRSRMANDGASDVTTTSSGDLALDTWHFATVVATKSGSTVTITLYLDAAATLSGNGSVDSTNEADYDRFALGRWAGSTGDKNPCNFRAEQVAVWDIALAEVADHDEMWRIRRHRVS